MHSYTHTPKIEIEMETEGEEEEGEEGEGGKEGDRDFRKTEAGTALGSSGYEDGAIHGRHGGNTLEEELISGVHQMADFFPQFYLESEKHQKAHTVFILCHLPD